VFASILGDRIDSIKTYFRLLKVTLFFN